MMQVRITVTKNKDVIGNKNIIYFIQKSSLIMMTIWNSIYDKKKSDFDNIIFNIVYTINARIQNYQH